MPCEVEGCGRPTEIVYYRHDVCDYHWHHHCAGTFSLKKTLGVME